ncbi:hypothetical protein [Rhizobium arsenicireducens]
MTASLEDQAISLRRRIAELEDQLKEVDARLHRKLVREFGLVGRLARSGRVPRGLIVDDVTFKTWAPAEPQSVSGYRQGLNIYTTIHINSPGFQIDDPHRSSNAAQQPGVPG